MSVSEGQAIEILRTRYAHGQMGFPKMQFGSVVARLVVQLALMLLLGGTAHLDLLLDVGYLSLQIVTVFLVLLSLGLEMANSLLHLILFLGLSLQRVLMSDGLVVDVLELSSSGAL